MSDHPETGREKREGAAGNDAPKSNATDQHNNANRAATQQLPAPLQPLTRYPYWVCWKWVKVNDKPTKVPFQCNGQKAKTDDPATWTTYDCVVEARGFDGIGFVLRNSEFAAFDLDHCLNPDTGFIEPWAKDLVERCFTYVEITPSGTGLRIIGRSTGDHLHRKLPVPNSNGMSCELFRKATRFITISGNKYVDRPLSNIDAQLDEVLAELEAAQKKNKKSENKSGGQLPRHLAALLFIPNPGAGKRCGEYTTRSEMLGGLIRLALDAKVSDNNIILPCVDKKYKGNAIYEHCQNNGGLDYVTRQVERLRALAPPAKSYVSIRASDLEPRAQEWIWEGHLLKGSQGLITGLPGLGKSQLQINFVATATTGKPWPDGYRASPPMSVIMLTAEDQLQSNVIPRLIAAGADRKKVHFLKCIKTENIKNSGRSRQFLLAEDLDQLSAMVKDIGEVGLITVDPITAYMGGRMDSHKATEVRSMLGPLKDFAEETGIAVSSVTHPPKSGGAAMNQFIGSQAFIAAGRVGHVCVEDFELGENNEKEPTGWVLFTNPKNNEHIKMPTLKFKVESASLGNDPVTGEPINTSKVVWGDGAVDMTADKALEIAEGRTKYRGEQNRIQNWLCTLLADGPVSSIKVVAQARSLGFTENQIKTAKDQLGVKSRRIGGVADEGEWVMELLFSPKR